MTILEMLDQLEVEIVELRSRNSELERLARTAPAKPASRKKASAKKKKAAKGSKTGKAKPKRTLPQQMSLEPKIEGTEPAKPTVGKRQALGRSIIQLRRMAAAAYPNHS